MHLQTDVICSKYLGTRYFIYNSHSTQMLRVTDRIRILKSYVPFLGDLRT
jgi:hypothetical protein